MASGWDLQARRRLAAAEAVVVPVNISTAAPVNMMSTEVRGNIAALANVARGGTAALATTLGPA